MAEYNHKQIYLQSFFESFYHEFSIPDYFDDIAATKAMEFEAEKLAKHIAHSALEKFKDSYNRAKGGSNDN